MKRSILITPLIILFSSMLAALASTPGETAPQEGSAPQIEIIEDAPSAAHKDALLKAVGAFWEAKIMGDLMSAYGMYLPEYKEAVSFQSFQNQKRAIVHEFTIGSATFWKDSCALVRLRLHLKTEVMEIKSAPAVQQWVLQDGKWLLFENPSKNSMFARKGRGLTSPCEPIPKRKRPTPAGAKNKEN